MASSLSRCRDTWVPVESKSADLYDRKGRSRCKQASVNDQSMNRSPSLSRGCLTGGACCRVHCGMLMGAPELLSKTSQGRLTVQVMDRVSAQKSILEGNTACVTSVCFRPRSSLIIRFIWYSFCQLRYSYATEKEVEGETPQNTIKYRTPRTTRISYRYSV